MNKIIKPKKKLSGIINVPGDKSISHRSIMLGAISEGITEIEGFLNGDDCISTISCFKKLGIKIEHNNNKIKVYGKGLKGLSSPNELLDVGNSGTTIRLMSGLLAGQSFTSEITGDSSIQKRPMNRVINPLLQMGSDIKSNSGFAPLIIKGTQLNGIEYTLPVASAQVKSALLLASLYSNSQTIINEPIATRNHTEIMLNYLGANIESKNRKIISYPVEQLYAKPVLIPGDISSAAYFIVAGLIIPNSSIIITNVGVNATRTGIISALKEMGGNVNIINRRNCCGEYIADIEVKSSKLNGCEFSGSIIPKMIDEIPVLTIAALFADGKTIIKDAQELKVKESNRINTMAVELSKLGAEITETEDGMIIQGNSKLHSAEVESHNDHRVAMSIAIAGMASNDEVIINNSDCVSISFPDFYDFIDKF